MAMHESRIGDLPKIRNFQVAFVSALKLPWVPEVFQVRSVPVPAKSVWETRAKKAFLAASPLLPTTFGRRSEVFPSESS